MEGIKMNAMVEPRAMLRVIFDLNLFNLNKKRSEELS